MGGGGSNTVSESERLQPVDNTLGWLLVIAPILIVVIDFALLASGAVEAYSYGFWIAIAFNTALAVTDSRLLNKRGYQVSSVLALFLIPFYLVQRSRATKQSYAMPAAWVALFIVSIAGSALVERTLGVLEMDMDFVEASIKSDVDRTFQTSATVTCPPETNYQVGEVFYCDVEDGTGSLQMEVTVENSNGDVTWRSLG